MSSTICLCQDYATLAPSAFFDAVTRLIHGGSQRGDDRRRRADPTEDAALRLDDLQRGGVTRGEYAATQSANTMALSPRSLAATITSPPNLLAAIAGKTGTHLVADDA